MWIGAHIRACVHTHTYKHVHLHTHVDYGRGRAICGDDDDTCYNSTDYWLLVGALVAVLTLTLQHGFQLLDKIFSIPFGKETRDQHA